MTAQLLLFEGNIYNSKALCKELQTDAAQDELILKAYGQWGEDFTRHFRGAYAIVLRDEDKQSLLFTRDPLGIIPLYIYCKGTNLRYATSVKQLLSEGVPAQLDHQGLLSALTYGSVQEPFTLVQDIRSLPPGTICHPGSPFKQTDLPIPTQKLKNEDALEDIFAEMKTVLKMQMGARANVLLSGGLDSAALVALLRQARSDITPHTYTMIFDSPNGDERQAAKLVATQHKTCHKELLLDIKTFRKYIGQAVDSYDQPSCDGLNTWFAAKLIHDTGGDMALTGLGGDELFIGYNRYDTAKRMESALKFLRFLPHGLGQALAQRTTDEKRRKTFLAFGYKVQPYYLARQIFSPLSIAELLDTSLESLDESWKATAFPHLQSTPFPHDQLNRFSYLDMTTYMRSTLLRDAFQMGKANHVELRSPYIDHILVEKILQLPGTVKVNPQQPKPLLVQAAKNGIPLELLTLPKQGFVLPFDHLFANAFRTPVKDFLNGSSVIFSPKALQRLGQLHQKHQLHFSRLWTLFTIDYFCKKYHLA